MKMLPLKLVDENQVQRETYADLFNALLEGTGIVTEPMTPLQHKEDFVEFLAGNPVGGLILDQKLQDGGFDYSGSELATFLRPIYPKLPILILMNHKLEKEQFEIGEKDVEYICAKEELIDPDSRDAQIIKARLLRHLDVFATVLDEREQRFHDLLVKSLNQALTGDEETELGLLKQARVLPIHAAEMKQSKTLDEALAELRECIASVQAE